MGWHKGEMRHSESSKIATYATAERKLFARWRMLHFKGATWFRQRNGAGPHRTLGQLMLGNRHQPLEIGVAAIAKARVSEAEINRNIICWRCSITRSRRQRSSRNGTCTRGTRCRAARRLAHRIRRNRRRTRVLQGCNLTSPAPVNERLANRVYAANANLLTSTLAAKVRFSAP